MARSGYWETVQDFHDTLQAAVARVSAAILLRDGPYPPSEPQGRLFLSAPKAPLIGGAGRHALSIALRFRAVPTPTSPDRWEIQTFAYSYLLFGDDREIAAYHWDPESVSVGAVRTPHVHFGKDLFHAGMQAEDRGRLASLASMHMPTGTIPFTAILRAAIRDLGADPICRQGEPIEHARIQAEDAFAHAEAVLMESFGWSNRPQKSEPAHGDETNQ